MLQLNQKINPHGITDLLDQAGTCGGFLSFRDQCGKIKSNQSSRAYYEVFGFPRFGSLLGCLRVNVTFRFHYALPDVWDAFREINFVDYGLL